MYEIDLNNYHYNNLQNVLKYTDILTYTTLIDILNKRCLLYANYAINCRMTVHSSKVRINKVKQHLHLYQHLRK